jgi:YbgC/YbaW family acyl-CoA thioester hydrolase
VEYLTDVGYGMDVMKERGFQIVVVELQARFLAAAGLRDVLIVTTSLLEIGRVTSTWSQEMTRGKQTIATLQVKAAFTDLSGRPRRVPEEFAAAFI